MLRPRTNGSSCSLCNYSHYSHGLAAQDTAGSANGNGPSATQVRLRWADLQITEIGRVPKRGEAAEVMAFLRRICVASPHNRRNAI